MELTKPMIYFHGCLRVRRSLFTQFARPNRSGFLHPMIHLGFGIEFEQPAIVAEALAQAALHDSYLEPYLLKSEEAARNTKDGPSTSMVELIEQVRADAKLSGSAHWEDGNKLRDGVLQRASREMISYASRWKADADELERKTAEMINAVGELRLLPTNAKCLIKIILHSLLHSSSAKSTETHQVRLLLHALRQLRHLFLVILVTTMVDYRSEDSAP